MMETSKHSTEKPVQLDDFCRLCLLRKPDLHPLLSQIQTMMVPEMLYKVTGALLNMHDQLPRVICERCLVKLELACNISEEFRKQEELLRIFSCKGVLLDELEEYQLSWRKPYSEEIIEKLTAVDDTIPLGEVPEHDSAQAVVIKQEATPSEDQLDLVKPELFEATEFIIEVLPDESTIDEEGKQPEWKQLPNEIMDNELEMVLELEDLRTIGALPHGLLEQLDSHQNPMNARKVEESVEGQSDGDKDTDYVPDKIENQDDEVIQEYSEIVPGDVTEYMEYAKGQFLCKICNKNCDTQEELNAHHLSRHKAGEKPYKFECRYCQVRFLRKTNLAAHETAHENRIAAGHPEPNQGPHKCPICSRRFPSMHRFNDHMRRHEYIEKGTFRCKVCNHPFGGSAELKRHESNHERILEQRDNIPSPILIKKDNKTLYKCGQCQSQFVCSSRFFQHAQEHIIRKSGLFRCQLCGKCYGTKKPLRHHQRKVHNLYIKSEPNTKETTMPTEPAPPVEIKNMLPRCCECDAFFLSQMDYKIHMRVHGSPANQEPSGEVTDESCQQLDDATLNESPMDIDSTSVELNESMALGSVWKCDECCESVTLRTDRTYREHKQKHERIRSVTQKCEICKIAFPTSSELRKHCEANHGFVKQRDHSQTKECPLCKKPIKQTNQRNHFLAHENIHLRRYVCTTCDAAFGAHYGLRKHVKSGICQEPGYVSMITEPLSTDNIQAFFKWISKQNTPTGAESLPIAEEQEQGLFKCTECGQMFEGFASAAYHTLNHSVRGRLTEGILQI